MSFDDRLRAARPDLRPSDEATACHRAALDRAIAADRNGHAARLSGPSSEVTVVPMPPSRSRRVRLVAAVAVACVTIAGLAGALVATRSSPSATVAVGEPASSQAGDTTVPETTETSISPPSTDPATTAATPVQLKCGTEFPFVVELLGSGGGLIDGPLPNSTPQPDQLVRHVVGTDVSVELRWPAGERPERGPLEPQAIDGDTITMITGRPSSDQGAFVELFLDVGAGAAIDGPGSVEPLARFTDLHDTGPDEACRALEMRLVDSSGRQSSVLVGLDPDPDNQETTGGLLGNNDPVVIETRTDVDIPTQAVECNGGIGDVPANVDRSIDESPTMSEPVDALIAFLTGPEGQTLHHSGYLEFIAPDGSITYARPFDGPAEAYVTIISVKPTDGGWQATHLTTSGC